jgi:hypothetical protein
MPPSEISPAARDALGDVQGMMSSLCSLGAEFVFVHTGVVLARRGHIIRGKINCECNRPELLSLLARRAFGGIKRQLL